jgi:hypothetical protein
MKSLVTVCCVRITLLRSKVCHLRPQCFFELSRGRFHFILFLHECSLARLPNGGLQSNPKPRETFNHLRNIVWVALPVGRLKVLGQPIAQRSFWDLNDVSVRKDFEG